MNKNFLISLILHCFVCFIIFVNPANFLIRNKNINIVPLDRHMVAEIVTKPTNSINESKKNNSSNEIEEKNNSKKQEIKKQTEKIAKSSVAKTSNVKKQEKKPKAKTENKINKDLSKIKNPPKKISNTESKKANISETKKMQQQNNDSKKNNNPKLNEKTKEEKRKEFEKIMQTIKENQIEQQKRTAAAQEDTKIAMELVQYIHSTFASCWNVPIITSEKKSYKVVVIIELENDGTIKNLDLKTQYDIGSIEYIVSNSAIRAIHQCSPIANLPKEKYYLWKNIELTFNTDKMYSD